MKLLDIYRVMNLKSNRKQLDDFIEVPSLTQIEPLEPLAISAPSPEELVIAFDIWLLKLLSLSPANVFLLVGCIERH